MKLLRKLKRIAGFTTQELLIVVAILGVLTAVAIPNIISYYRSLRLTELDDSARAIFMAAQNRMTAMINSGELATLGGTAFEADVKPSDWPAGDAVMDLRYLNSAEDSTLASLLPTGSIESDLQKGHYVVEYSPRTGAVYAVWYTDNEGLDNYAPGRDTSRETRIKSPQVGYYGGNAVERPSVGQMPIPKVTLINAEELRLDIELDMTGLDVDTGLANGDNIILEVKVGDTEVEVKKEYYEGLGVFHWTLLLDRLGGGQQFKDWLGAYSDLKNSINPGDDITFDIKVSYKGTLKINGAETELIPQKVSATTNSLFARVEDHTAQIAYGRHLQNLNSSVSGVSENIKSAVQIRAINFNDSYSLARKSGTLTAQDLEHWSATYGYKEQPFTPIENSNLKSYDGQSLPIRSLNATKADTQNAGLFGGFTGEKLENIVLIDANVTGTTYAGALAGSVSGVSVTGCQVYLEPASTTEDTTAYSTETKITAPTAGGLIGSAQNSTITDSFASTVVSGSTAANSTVGGLIGSASGSTTIKTSYAAGHLSGGTVGGLLGSASNVTVTNCYAAGTIASASSAAGISPSSLTLSNSYAAVRYSKNIKNAIGTVPNDASTSTNRYVAQSGVKYQNGGKSATAEELATWATNNNWYRPGAGETGNPEYAALPYNIDPYENWDPLTPPYPYPMLNNGTMPVIHYGDWLEETGESYLVYYERYEDNTYGFYALEVSENTTTTIINTLKTGTPGETDASKRVYAVEDGYALLTTKQLTEVKWGTQTLNPTLKELTVPVKGKALENCSVFLLPYAAVDVTKVTPSTNYYHTIELDDTTYWYNPHFACEAINGETTPSLTTIQSKSGLKYGTSNLRDSTGAAGYSGVVIRTARQLANVAEHTTKSTIAAVRTNSSTWTYHQLLDIDYDKYTLSGFTTGKSTNKQTPAALSVDNATNPTKAGSYDGHEFQIKNLYIKNVDFTKAGTTSTTESYAGLFGQVYGGQLRNIRLVNIQINISGGKRVGGLVGFICGTSSAKGIVNNCGIYVEGDDIDKTYTTFSIKNTGNEDDFVGGLIGSTLSYAEISDSFAAVMVRAGRRAGGFAGNINGDLNTTPVTIVSNCYAAGHTNNGSQTWESGKDYLVNVAATKGQDNTAFVGGFAGEFGAAIRLNGTCYSTCTVGIFTGYTNISGMQTFYGRRDDNANGTKNGTQYTWTNSGATDPYFYALGLRYKGSDNNVWTLLSDSKAEDSTIADNDTPKGNGNLTSNYTQENLTGWKSKDKLEKTTNVSAVPYDSLPNTYPYPSVTTGAGAGKYVHHGDWPVTSDFPDLHGYLVYYERYDYSRQAVRNAVTNAAYYIESYPETLKDRSVPTPVDWDNDPNTGLNGDGYESAFGFYVLGFDDDGNQYCVENSLLLGVSGRDEADRVYVTEDGYGIILDPDRMGGQSLSDMYNIYLGDMDSYGSELPNNSGHKKYEQLKNGILDPIRIAPNADLYRLSPQTLDLKNDSGVDRSGAILTDYFANMQVRKKSDNSVEWSYYYNPFFACSTICYMGESGTDPGRQALEKQTIWYVDYDELEAGNNPLKDVKGTVIRSARQLGGLMKWCNSSGSAGWTQFVNGMNIYQLFDIDFDKYEWHYTLTSTYNGFNEGRTSVDALQPLVMTNSSSYDGREFVVRNLYTKAANNGDAGFIDGSNLSNNTQDPPLKNIRLVNIHVAGGSGNTGALAGVIGGNNEIVRNCGVYVDIDEIVRTPDMTDEQYQKLCADAYDAAYNSCTVTGTGTVGGLIGKSTNNNIAITESFAAVKVSGNIAGGFIGSSSIGQSPSSNDGIINCYAGGYTVNGQYPSANVTGTSKAGGFAGEITSGYLRGIVFSTASVGGNGTKGLFAGTGSYQSSATIYAIGQVFDGSASGSYTVKNQKKLDYFATHNYDTFWNEAIYPYQVWDGMTDFYGDWVTVDYIPEDAPDQEKASSDSSSSGGGGSNTPAIPDEPVFDMESEGNQWNRVNRYKLTIPNHGSSDATNWKVVIKVTFGTATAANVDDTYHYSISLSGNTITITPNNGTTIPADGKIDIGFTISFSGDSLTAEFDSVSGISAPQGDPVTSLDDLIPDEAQTDPEPLPSSERQDPPEPLPSDEDQEIPDEQLSDEQLPDDELPDDQLPDDELTPEDLLPSEDDLSEDNDDFSLPTTELAFGLAAMQICRSIDAYYIPKHLVEPSKVRKFLAKLLVGLLCAALVVLKHLL